MRTTGGTAWPLWAVTLAVATSACSTEPSPPRDVPLAARAPEAPRARRAHKRTIEPVFEADGVTLARPGGPVRVSPTGFGCDGAIAALGPPSPPAHGARVSYARPEMDEWYVAGATFVEQGFSIAAPPRCRSQAGKGVVVVLGGVLDAALEGTRSAVVRDPSGPGSLWCSGLHVTDATGRELPSSLVTEGRSLAIRFDDTGARYPVTVDPTWQQQAELLGPTAGERFGAAVAVAPSGDTALVGAPGAGAGTGAVYIYVLSAGAWSLQQRITPSDPEAGSGFGVAVAVAGDVLVVGAPGGGNGAGHAYIYLRSGSTWAQQSEIGTTLGPAFGTAVALDGETMVITQLEGPASVYGLSGPTMTYEQGIEESDFNNDGFGSSVALSGGTLLVGAPSGATQGAAYAFTGPPWSLQQALVAPDGFPGDGFGRSVAVDSSTSTAAVAANPTTSGAAYVFAQAGQTWTELQEVKSADPQFGSAVALGDQLTVSGVGADGKGFVSVYADASSMALLVLQPTDGAANDGFGAPLAQAMDTVIVAAPGHGDTGAAYVYSFLGEAGDACATATDCFSGFCVGGACGVPAPAGAACATAVECESGFCIEGVCGVPAQAGEACAMAVDCESGFCVDGVCCTVASCPGAGACTAAATCQPGTGTCSSAPAKDGQPCDAGTACAASASCLGGVCSAAEVCPPPDDCHEFGVCDPTTGSCTNPAKPDGQPCSTGSCVAGACVGTVADAGRGGAGGGITRSPGNEGGCGCRMGEQPGSRAGFAITLALAALAWLSRARRGGCNKDRPPSVIPARRHQGRGEADDDESVLEA